MKEEKLIYHVLKKNNLYHKKDDLVDVGYIGLAKGIKNYDPSKKIKKSTYLCRCIENEIFGELRKEKAYKRAGIVVPVEEYELENMACDTNLEKEMVDYENNKLLYDNIFKLPVKEQYTIYQLYFRHKKISYVANRLGISVNKALLLKNKALLRLKDMY